MRIPTWRVALTGGAIAILVIVCVGFVAASSVAPTSPTAAEAAPSASPASSGKDRLGRPGFKALSKHLVHATVTLTDRDGNLVTIQLDHGTIAVIGSGSLTIAEAGGSSVTVATDARTAVFLIGTGKGSLDDLKVGDELFIQSRVDGGTVLAKRVLRAPESSAG